MGNSCGCGATAPVTSTVIMGRMRSNTDRPIDYRTSFVVTTQADVEEKMKKRGSNREMVMSFIKNDIYALRFTARELAALTDLFKRHATVKTSEVTRAMTKMTFFDLVALNSTKSEKARADERILLDELFHQFDEDQNGVLDLKEFLLGFSFWREKLSSSSDKCLFAFTLFDRDKNGTMDCEEFEQVVKYMLKVSSEKSLAALTESCKADIEAFVSKAFESADADGSGFIDIEELLQWLQQEPDTMRALGSSEEAMRAAFLIYDKDGNGTLDKEEFTELLYKTHGLDKFEDEELNRKAAAVVAEIFDRVDLDGSGELDFEEFRHWLTHSPEASSAILFSESKGQAATGSLVRNVSIRVRDEDPKKHSEREDGHTVVAPEEGATTAEESKTVFTVKQRASLPRLSKRRSARDDTSTIHDNDTSTVQTDRSSPSVATKAMNWLFERNAKKDTQDIVHEDTVHMHPL